MKTETYEEYLKLFEENMKASIESVEDQSSKEILADLKPMTEPEWKEAIENGLFDLDMDEEALMKLYEDIVKMYPYENKEDE
jgi:hypothetical protein